MKQSIILVLVAFLLSACGQKPVASEAGQPAGQNAAKTGDEVDQAPAMGAPSFKSQTGWTEEQVTSNMRIAQFRLPKVEGDAEDAEVVVFWFNGDGGGVDNNLNRWETQFADAEGGPVPSKRSNFMVKGRRIDLIELEGTWAGSMGKGAGPGKAMVGAVIENEKGLYFARLVGPAKTVFHWQPSYMSFLKSVY
ncbi:MAG: hypothetical protein H6807_16050 [Planctomycetes bacterium]|nr:hypothetical protein [Planctomycetota bacterium]